MYYKVGEPVFIHHPMWNPLGGKDRVGVVIEKYNTPQFAKQMISTDATEKRNAMSTTYTPRIHYHKDNLELSPEAFKSFDIQYRDYLIRNKVPHSGRWHKYYLVLSGDTKVVCTYKDLKKMHK